MKNWNNMPPEIKYMIVDNMDIITRERLKMCSKADKCIVESTPFTINHMYILLLHEYEDCPSFYIYINMEKSKKMMIVELENGKQVICKSGGYNKCIQFSNTEEAIKWMNDFYTSILLDTKMKIECFKTNRILPETIANHETKLKLKNVELHHTRAEEMLKWLNILDSSLEQLSIHRCFLDNSNVMQGIGSHPLVVNAKRLLLGSRGVIDDEKLLNLKCNDLNLFGSPITTSGFRKLIKKVIEEDYPIESKWVIHSHYNLDELLEGYNANTRGPYGDNYKYVFVPINKHKKIELLWKDTCIEIKIVPCNQPFVDHIAMHS